MLIIKEREVPVSPGDVTSWSGGTRRRHRARDQRNDTVFTNWPWENLTFCICVIYGVITYSIITQLVAVLMPSHFPLQANLEL